MKQRLIDRIKRELKTILGYIELFFGVFFWILADLEINKFSSGVLTATFSGGAVLFAIGIWQIQDASTKKIKDEIINEIRNLKND